MAFCEVYSIPKTSLCPSVSMPITKFTATLENLYAHEKKNEPYPDKL
ncbi:MAG: hypothetical protein OXC03_02970 [Flavobacteriaceae bacterium]|nr:hypothetical protein [Flavobacteriaceae bacterium]